MFTVKYLSDGQRLEYQSTYLEQFDFGKGELIYQISCHGFIGHYTKRFSHIMSPPTRVVLLRMPPLQFRNNGFQFHILRRQ